MPKDIFVISSKHGNVWYQWAWTDTEVSKKSIKKELKSKLRKGESVYLLEWCRFYNSKTETKRTLPKW